MTRAWLDSVWREALAPELAITVSAWADRNRILPPTSAEPGPWRSSRTPYLSEIMNALSTGSRYERVILMKGAQLGATAVLAKPQDHLSREDMKSVAEQAGDFIKKAPEDADHLPEHIHAFREEFKELLDAADIDQLVVIVDDLDRCLPQTAIATLEAIRLFLFVERTAFVIGADELMIEYAVREHFPDLPPSSGPVSYARNYLEKLIQVPFRIPALGLAETRVYVTLLLAENALGTSDRRFIQLLGAAREDMKRPWKSRGLDRKTVETAMGGTVPPEIDQALVLSAHVTKILSEGTRGNPRQIKRFLNSMMLRHAIAEERGFGAEVQRPVLAKIMLAERFYPDFYEQIARLTAGANDGKPEAVARFEDYVRNPAFEGDDDDKPVGKGVRKAPRTLCAIYTRKSSEEGLGSGAGLQLARCPAGSLHRLHTLTKARRLDGVADAL
jgi:KAP family P-loop domain